MLLSVIEGLLCTGDGSCFRFSFRSPSKPASLQGVKGVYIGTSCTSFSQVFCTFQGSVKPTTSGRRLVALA